MEHGLVKITLPEAKHPSLDELLAWLRHYGERNINSVLIDERRCIPPNILLDLGNQGLFGMRVSREFGGLDLSYHDTFKIIEQLAAIDTSIAILVGLNSVLGIRPIDNFASSAIREKALPLMAKGRVLGAFAVTEPDAGSNPRSMNSTARPAGEGAWVLNGEKVWIGNAAWANYINVFVKMVDENDRFIGITGFVLDRNTPGLVIGEEALTMGVKGLVQNRIYLRDVPVTREQMLGEPGKGFEVAQDAMKMGRLGMSAICLGAMKRCFNLVMTYAKQRKIITGQMIDNPFVLHVLHEQAMRIETVQTFLDYVTKELDEGRELPEEIYLTAKILAPEYLWESVDESMQLLGGRGYIETNILPQILRDARLLRIFEGPTETMAFYLGMLFSQKSLFQKHFIKEAHTHDLLDNIRKNLLFGHPELKPLQPKTTHLLGMLSALLINKTICGGNWLDQQILQRMEDLYNQDVEADPHSAFKDKVSRCYEDYCRDVGFLDDLTPGIDFEADDLLKR
jgi:alkylation response protein AidB-like acyl-CoA dehydrogenase